MADTVPCSDIEPHPPHGWTEYEPGVFQALRFCPGVPDMAAEEAARMALALGGFTFQDITPQHWRD